MGSMYKRGNMLWVAFKDVRGERICKSTGYKVGQEAQAQALLAELDTQAESATPDAQAQPQAQAQVLLAEFGKRRTDDADDADDVDGLDDVDDAVPAVIPITSRVSLPTRAALVDAVESASNGVTVREYGEEWLTSRADIATIRDERGRLRNHVFPLLGDMRMVDVRPRHIRDFVKALRRSRVHLRGTGKGRGTELLAPRTVRHVFALLKQLFESAIIDEVVAMNPVRVKKGVLPKNVDKDPAWRAGAIFDRDELVRLVSERPIPWERRILYAIKGMAGARHGEAAGLRWQLYNASRRPLGEFVLARSYEKDGTKTMVTRSVPVHPVLAALLDAWYREGWEAVYGRPPTPGDFIVPRSLGQRIGEMDEAVDEDDWEAADDDEAAQVSSADHAQKLFLRDLAALGMRRRRGHDLRRTFITLAQRDGAQRDALQVITHAPDAEDVMSLYTSFPFEALCEEVAKFKISLPPTGGTGPASRPPRQEPADPGVASPVVGADARMAPPTSGPHLKLVPPSAAPEIPPEWAEEAVAADMAEMSGASPAADRSATCSATCSSGKPNNFEPLPGYDPGTYGLRNRCSTTELQRRGEG